MESDQRKSLRNIITREMIANTLIHREFTSAYQAKFVIENDRMYVENANRSAQSGVITPKNIEPPPKNPIIASFFRNIGYADQLGSGVRNLFKYSRHYSGREPEFLEGDVFRITVPLDNSYLDSDNQITAQLPIKNTETTQSTTQIVETTQFAGSGNLKAELDIAALMRHNPAISQKQIAEQLNRNVDTVKYYIRKMQEQGKIERVGSFRKGKWLVK
ncbi:winged helix-turn-helix transcriptional regulator [Lachnospiraceae bacterium 29-91]